MTDLCRLSVGEHSVVTRWILGEESVYVYDKTGQILQEVPSDCQFVSLLLYL